MKFTILFLTMLLSASLYAQQNPPGKNEFTPPMFLRAIGMSFQEFDELNSRVASRPEYKTLRDHTGTLEFGFFKTHNRFVSVVDFILGSSMSGDRDKKSSTIRYAGAGIDLGYDVLANEKHILYPTIGIGGQAYQARFFTDNSAIPFDLVLESPTVQNAIRPVNFTNEFFTYRLGIGYAVKSSRKPSVNFGIRVSYVGSFKDQSWKSNDNQELADAPADGLSQFTISLVLINMPKFMTMK